MEPVIQVENLIKSYGRTQALKGISFKVDRGELFGMIGPDGSGKTTLFRILTTLLKPDEGRASVLGLDVVRDYRSIRPRVGYMPGRFSLYQDMSVEENLEFFASVFGTTIDENYDLVRPIYRQLEPFRDRLAGALSGGMKQKLALSCALIHRPEVLFLDEPTTGVDAVSRKEFWEMLDIIKSQGIGILVSTPYMDEASRCDRVALIQEGMILESAGPGEIVNEFKKQFWAVRAPQKYDLIQALRRFPGIESVHPFGESVHITMMQDQLDESGLVQFLDERGVPGARIDRVKPGVEDIFMQLMEREVKETDA